MKLPSGSPLIRNEPVKNGDVSPILAKLPDTFNGYIAVTGIGYSGVEEAIFLVDNNTVTHAYYVHLKYGYEEKGDGALEKAFTVFHTGGANVDVVELTVPKLKLTASFNDDARLSKPFPLSDLPKLIPASYKKDHVVRIMKLLPAGELSSLLKLIELGLKSGDVKDLR